MKVAHVLQPQDIAMLSAVHKKIGSILDAVNGKAQAMPAAATGKKRGPKPGAKAAKKAAKKYDPNTVEVQEEAEPATPAA